MVIRSGSDVIAGFLMRQPFPIFAPAQLGARLLVLSYFLLLFSFFPRIAFERQSETTDEMNGFSTKIYCESLATPKCLGFQADGNFCGFRLCQHAGKKPQRSAAGPYRRKHQFIAGVSAKSSEACVHLSSYNM